MRGNRIRQRAGVVHDSFMQPVSDEHFVSWQQTPEQMDALWETGWRHFGPIFYRYQQCLTPAGLRNVQPLRIDVQNLALSKSQRRILRKNSDVELRVRPAELLDDRRRLFELHKRRFTDNVPNSLEDFLGPAPQAGPCLTVEVGAFLDDRLIAASFLDVGETSVSSIYAFFDPAESRRSLGNATLIWEILLARRTGKIWHYPGYAYLEPSSYDYKKRFAPMQVFDWKSWRPTQPDPAG
jgi:arginine-tRNA-protein transferase